jgi:SAM-dependent methyltransferase
MTVVNTHQADAWNGYEGSHWADHHDRYDAANGGFNRFLLRHVADGDRVLDVGCGTGQVSRQAAAGPAAHVTGVDLSAPMLNKGRALAEREGIGDITFVRGDAQVYPFEPASYDLAISRFGIMFFGDPVAAFANIGAALRPGGRVAFLSMREPSALGRALAAMDEHLPPPPPSPDGTSPVSLSDPARIAEVFAAAGFVGVRAEPVEAEQVCGTDAEDAASFFAQWGPIRYALQQAPRDAAERAVAALVPAFRPYEKDGAVRLPGAAQLITATRP